MPIIIRNIFEEYCKEKFDVKDCVAVNNGSSALIAPLWSMDLQPGDEIITTPFTFISTSTSITIAGGIPVFVDIKEENYLIDENKIEAAITDKTRAILPVHLYGQPCNMEAIMAIAEKHNLIVIEDCAQSFGAQYKGQMVGTFGDVGAFSFHKTKTMSTFEGGMILTPHHSRLDDEKIRAITNQGQIGKYIFRHDPIVNKINVFEKPASSEPEWFIDVSENLSEKDFHYEIMDWYAKFNS